MTPEGAQKGRRVILLCEGDTEEIAVRHFIARQWHADGLRSVGLHTVNLNGRLQDAPTKASLFLDESEVIGVFTLIDLCGMDRVSHLSEDTLDTKVERVREWLRSRLKHARSAHFFPHVCVHEIEAWLLAEGAALARRLDDLSIKPDPQAELKNFLKPPRKRINELFLSRKSDRYLKIRDGRPLFAALQFVPVYRSCKFFREFYDNLRSAVNR